MRQDLCVGCIAAAAAAALAANNSSSETEKLDGSDPMTTTSSSSSSSSSGDENSWVQNVNLIILWYISDDESDWNSDKMVLVECSSRKEKN